MPDPAAPSNFNKYSYTLNSPLVYTDPSGHCVFGLPCPKPIEDALNLVVDVAEKVPKVVESTRKKVSRAASAAQRQIADQARSAGNAAGDATLDYLGIEDIYLLETPAGNNQLVIKGKSGSLINELLGENNAVTGPGFVVSGSETTNTFLSAHEGTHYDEWLDDPLLWHINYGLEFAEELIFYGSPSEAYYASDAEQRAYAVSSPNRPPQTLTPQDYSILTNPFKYFEFGY